ncbi:transglutaminase family protein [Streptomyces mirabilis]
MKRTALRELPWITTAMAAAGFTFGSAFAYRDLVLPVLVAVLVSASAVVALRRVRPGWGPEADLPVLAALGVAVCAVLLFHGTLLAQGPWQALREAGSAAAHVWFRLGLSLPASGRAEALTAPFALTWAATVTAVELRLRAGVGGAALLPAVGATTVALVLCAPQTAGGVVPAIVLAFAAAADLFRRSAVSAPPGALRGVGAVGITACCLIAAVLVATGSPWLTERLPYELRQRTAEEPSTALDPLTQAAAWAARPDRTLFRTSGPAPQAWVLADLDHYDGTQWRPSGPFVPAASLAYLSRTRPAGIDVTHTTVRVEEMTGPYVPLPAGAVSVAGLPVRASKHDSTVLAQFPLRRGSIYRAAAPRGVRLGPDLTGELVPDRSAPVSSALPTTLPDGLTSLIGRATGELPPSATPYQRASALARWLGTHYAYRPSEAGDQTLGGAERLLATKQGPAAAFATVFALAARELDMPTRVAVGFSAGTRRPDGSRVITGADVKVWAEVRFTGVGWVPFDLLPRPTTGPTAGLNLPTAQAPRRTTTPSATSSPSPRTTPSALPSPPPPTSIGATAVGGPTKFPWVLVLAGVGTLLLLAVTGVSLVAPRLGRRRARRRATAAGRILGAWDSAVNRLIRHRLLARRAPRDPERIAAVLRPGARATLTPQLTALGALATQARYGEPDDDKEAPHPPYWPRLTGADAERAWQLEAEIADRCRSAAKDLGFRGTRRPFDRTHGEWRRERDMAPEGELR